MRNIVEIKEVFKTIDKEEILSGINLQIAEGEIYGFLGPNGAGKTTLMKCMLSLSTVTSGSIEIFGKNFRTATKCWSKTCYRWSVSDTRLVVDREHTERAVDNQARV